MRVWVLWAALGLLLVMFAVFPRYRQSLVVYACCFWILIVWFILARTKTIAWVGLARMFSVGVVWAWVIASASYQMAGWAGLKVDTVGAGTAIAAFTEESLKLVPVIVLAIVAPGRVRRFAAVDWLLLGLASGLGFQAWEDLLRRLAAQVIKPGLLDLLFDNRGPGSGSPVYGWGPLSGGSGKWAGTDVYGYAGHHVFTALVTATVGLGIAAWRHSRRTPSSASRRSARSLWAWRFGAVGLPVLAWFLVITDHFSYNAALNDSTWPDADRTTSPWPLREVWALTGKGTAMGWLLLIVFLACLLVDAHRLHRAGAATDLANSIDAKSVDQYRRLTGWLGTPRLAIERWSRPLSTSLAPPWRRPATVVVESVVALVVYTGRDLTLVAAAHAGTAAEGASSGEPETDDPSTGQGTARSRREAIVQGRATAVMLRQLRVQALDVILEQPDVTAQERIRFEIRARRRARLIALAALGAVLLVALLFATLAARRIGTDLTPGGGLLDNLLGWLAGQFDNLGQWWAGRSTGEKLLIGAGIAALIALSGGSLTLAFGVSGAATYLAEHGRGAADFTRRPTAATRSWLSTTTPATAVLDLAELGLTFAPGNFAGAATGRGIRALTREYLDDPAAFLARRRALIVGDQGSSELPFGGGLEAGGLADHEIAQATEIAQMRKGEFIGVPKRDDPGIDGWLNGEPVSLKQYQGSSPAGVLSHVSRAERSAANAGYTQVDLYVHAESVDQARLLDFAAQGPLAEIPGQGVLRTIYIKTSAGWITIPGDLP